MCAADGRRNPSAMATPETVMQRTTMRVDMLRGLLGGTGRRRPRRRAGRRGRVGVGQLDLGGRRRVLARSSSASLAYGADRRRPAALAAALGWQLLRRGARRRRAARAGRRPRAACRCRPSRSPAITSPSAVSARSCRSPSAPASSPTALLVVGAVLAALVAVAGRARLLRAPRGAPGAGAARWRVLLAGAGADRRRRPTAPAKPGRARTRRAAAAGKPNIILDRRRHAARRCRPHGAPSRRRSGFAQLARGRRRLRPHLLAGVVDAPVDRHDPHVAVPVGARHRCTRWTSCPNDVDHPRRGAEGAGLLDGRLHHQHQRRADLQLPAGLRRVPLPRAELLLRRHRLGDASSRSTRGCASAREKLSSSKMWVENYYQDAARGRSARRGVARRASRRSRSSCSSTTWIRTIRTSRSRTTATASRASRRPIRRPTRAEELHDLYRAGRALPRRLPRRAVRPRCRRRRPLRPQHHRPHRRSRRGVPRARRLVARHDALRRSRCTCR